MNWSWETLKSEKSTNTQGNRIIQIFMWKQNKTTACLDHTGADGSEIYWTDEKLMKYLQTPTQYQDIKTKPMTQSKPT